MLTSYRYRGVELNDDINYLVPLAELNLDDRQTAEENWVYRDAQTPLPTGITLREGVTVLNLYIRASSTADFNTKLNALYQLFDTRDPAYYRLERKFPHEQYYRYIEVAPRQFTVNRLERKVSITLYTPERAWKDDTWNEQTWTLFNGPSRTIDVSLTYDGFSPVGPVVEVKALTIGSDGPVPLYYRTVDVWTADTATVVGSPVLIASGWNVQSLISAEKMRSDSLDISVTLPDGTALNRLVVGADTARRVWVKPAVWPRIPKVRLAESITNVASSITIRSLDGQSLTNYLPNSATIAIENEQITYTGFTLVANYANGDQAVTLLNCQRGVGGTTAAGHGGLPTMRIKFRTQLRINYGYAPAYVNTYMLNDFSGWPLLDYEVSTNTSWVQTNANNRAATEGDQTLVWSVARDVQKAQSASEYTFGDIASGKARLHGVQLPGVVTKAIGVLPDRARLVCRLPSPTGRYVGSARLKYTLTAGDGQFPTVAVAVRRVFDRFGEWVIWGGAYTQLERNEDVHTASQSSGSAQKDTGYVSTLAAAGYGWWQESSHLAISFTQVPTDSDDNRLRLTLDWVEYVVDVDRGQQILTSSLSAEQGLNGGTFPVYMSWRNMSDPTGEQFTIYPRLVVNGIAAYDCAAYNVTGALLSHCTYERPTWLRLLPGSNTLRFIGVTGIGQVEVKLKWKNVY